MKRVKFHSTRDLASSHYLSILEQNFESYKSNNNPSINDIIEFYNVQKYVEKDMFLLSWSQEFIKELKEFCKTLTPSIHKFLNTLSSEDFKYNYSLLKYDETNDFLKIINENKSLRNKFSQEVKELLQENPSDIYIFTSFKNIVNEFGSVIRDILISDFKYTELIISHYHLDSHKERYMPRELSNEDRVKMIKAYIRSESPNINYLRHIPHLKEIKLSPKIIFEANKKIEEEEEKIFSGSEGVSYSTSIMFVENQEKEVLISNRGLKSSYSYSLNWIKENKGYSTLLNNFIYLFGYVDNHMKISFTLKRFREGSLEKLMNSSSKYTYNTNTVFDIADRLSLYQLSSYYNVLEDLNTRLEEVLEWFYSSYLIDEFNIQNFEVYLPSEGATFRDKCLVN